jgi:Spy/CpxP family protein refolding chaperone
MTLKKLSMVLLATGALSFGAYVAVAGSNQHGSPEQMIEKRLEHMKSELGLNDAQVAKIKTIYEQNAPTITADRNAVKAAEKGSEAQKAAEQKMHAEMQEVQSQIMPILTPEQQTKWKDEMAKHEGEHHGD